MTSKKYRYDYDDYEDGEKDANTLAKEILEDPKLESLEEIIVGCWGESYGNGVQPIIDIFTDNKDKFSYLKSLFIGDMDYEECEVSWIEQGDYSRLWAALPNLSKLTIKGANNMILGNISHANLKSLEIICGGLPKNVIGELAKAELPSLESLNIYLGVESYGFDGGIEDVEKLLRHVSSFKNLKHLGLGNSELQDEITELVMKSEIVTRLERLELSNGTLSDRGAKHILDHKEKLVNLKELDLHYHFLSDKMMKMVKSIGIPVNLDSQNEDDKRYGNYPMLTE